MVDELSKPRTSAATSPPAWRSPAETAPRQAEPAEPAPIDSTPAGPVSPTDPPPPSGSPPKSPSREPAAPQDAESAAHDNPFFASLLASAERAWKATRSPSPGADAAALEGGDPSNTDLQAEAEDDPPPPEWSASGAPLESAVNRVEGLRIHAVERPGRVNDVAVILIHGAGLDHRDWTFSFIDALGPSHRVIAFDRPGFGRSARPSIAGGLPATQARLLRLAAREMGVERAVLVGHSWGGAVAMAWGLDAPESVIGVASLAGAVAPWSLASSIEHGRRLRAAAQMAMRPGGLREAAITGLSESFEPAEIPDGYLDHIATDLRLTSGAAAATAGDIATVNGALGLQIQRYRGFDRPVELVYGGADRILSPSEQGEAAMELLPNATLKIMPEAGHMLHQTHAATCVAAVRRLLQNDEARTTASQPFASPSSAWDLGRERADPPPTDPAPTRAARIERGAPSSRRGGGRAS